MSKLFISHSSLDDTFVRELRWTLADLKQEVWIDSRELRGGDPLWPEIQRAIEESSAVAVVVSPNSLQANPHFSREMRVNGKTAPGNTSIRAWPGYMAATLWVGSTSPLASAGSRFDGAVLR